MENEAWARVSLYGVQSTTIHKPDSAACNVPSRGRSDDARATENHDMSQRRGPTSVLRSTPCQSALPHSLVAAPMEIWIAAALTILPMVLTCSGSSRDLDARAKSVSLFAVLHCYRLTRNCP
jgi:hypothetical protein